MGGRRASTRVARRYRVAPGAAHREIEGQVLLLGPDDSALLTLNATGRFIWRRLVRGRLTAEIARAFRREFRVSEDVAREDVGRLLRELEARKLITQATRE